MFVDSIALVGAAALGAISSGAPGTGAPAAAQATTLTVWELALKGGVVMIPIGICSLVGLAIVVERLISLRQSRVIPPSFIPGLKQIVNGGSFDVKRAIEHCERDNSPVARVFAAGVRRVHQPAEALSRAIEEAGAREAILLRKRLRALSVIGSIAPLLGLLGTIFGMIAAFQTVAGSGDALGRTELLAGGIYEALITTAAGLLVAIPAVLCYHWIAARIERLVIEMDRMTAEFIDSVSLGEMAPGGAIARENGQSGAGGDLPPGISLRPPRATQTSDGETLASPAATTA